MKKGFLVLETGDIFEGTLIGHPAETSGEVVFNTSMTGFQEMLTDPGYAGQILTFCYPLVGNCGLNPEDNESERIHAQGVVIGELSETYSHYQAQSSLAEALEKAEVPGIANIDTRALVNLIRKQGTLMGVITDSIENIQKREIWLRNRVPDSTTNWVEKVSTREEQEYLPVELPASAHVVVMDFGVKDCLFKHWWQKGVK